MKKIIYLILFALVVSSCEVLDQQAESEISNDLTFKTEKDLNAAVIGAYNILATTNATGHADMTRKYLHLGELCSDTYISSVSGTMDNIKKHNLNNTFPQSNWQNIYQAINNINNVIYYGSKMPDNVFLNIQGKNRLLGEAYFLRAFCYSYLVKAFDRVVYAEEPIFSAQDEFNRPQVEASQTLALVEADLLKAQRLLPATYPSSNRGRVTKGAAHAFLVDLYVYMSSPYAKTNFGYTRSWWTEANAFADSVLKNSNYKLMSGENYGMIFTSGNSTESILEFQYDGLVSGPNSVNFLGAMFLPPRNIAPTGGAINLLPSDKLINTFKASTGDKRFFPSMEEVKKDPVNHETNPYSWTGRVGKIYSTGPYKQTNNNYYVKKYLGTVQGTLRYSDSNVILMRLPDVILMKAEALLAMGNQSGADTELKKITDRAGIVPRTATLNEILNQRWLELCFEGDRWFDLKRHMLIEQETGVTHPGLYFFPIINGELVNNLNVKQTPGGW